MRSVFKVGMALCCLVGAFQSFGLRAEASLLDEQVKIRSLLPKGYDIAQSKSLTQYQRRGISEPDLADALKRNYLVYDFTGDGVDDILVIAEKDPTFVIDSGESSTPCVYTGTNYDCTIVYGERELRFYKGQKDGSYKLVFSNGKVVATGGMGGRSGDPLEGLKLTDKRTRTVQISITAYGGGNLTFNHVDTVQYLQVNKKVGVGDFYLIGISEGYYPSDTIYGPYEQLNFITGEKVTFKAGKKSSEIQPLKPLQRLRDYVSDFYKRAP